LSDFKKVQVKLDKLFDELIPEQEWKGLGEYARDLIKSRSRKGSGVDRQGGKSTRLKPLKDTYKKQRTRLKSRGALSSETTPGKSNLTRSGEMLDNITVKPVKNGAELQFANRKLSERAKAVSDKGRPFFTLSASELKKVNKLIKDAIKANIKKMGL
jgi:hypothetical protein